MLKAATDFWLDVTDPEIRHAEAVEQHAELFDLGNGIGRGGKGYRDLDIPTDQLRYVVNGFPKRIPAAPDTIMRFLHTVDGDLNGYVAQIRDKLNDPRRKHVSVREQHHVLQVGARGDENLLESLRHRWFAAGQREGQAAHRGKTLDEA